MKTIRLKKKYAIILAVCGVCILLLTLFSIFFFVRNNDSKKEDEAKEEYSLSDAKKLVDKYVYGGYYLLAKEALNDDYKNILAITKSSTSPKVGYNCASLFTEDVLIEGKYIKSKNGDQGLCNLDQGKFYEYYLYNTVNTSYQKLFEGSALKISVSTSNFDNKNIYAYSAAIDAYVLLDSEKESSLLEEENKILESFIKDGKLHIVFSYYNYVNNTEGLEKELYDGNIADENKLNIKLSANPTNDEKESIFTNNKDTLPKYEIVFKVVNDTYIPESVSKK